MEIETVRGLVVFVCLFAHGLIANNNFMYMMNSGKF